MLKSVFINGFLDYTDGPKTVSIFDAVVVWKYLAWQTPLAESNRIKNKLNSPGFGIAERSYKVTANCWNTMNVKMCPQVTQARLCASQYYIDLQKVP